MLVGGSPRVKLSSLRGGCFRFVQVIFLLILGLSIAGITSLTALLNHYAEGLPDVSKLRYFEPSETTRIYSADGKLIATLFKENRTWTPYDKMSPYLIKAILAVEDSRFYQHHGVDPIGVARAAVYDLMHKGEKQGASTITMQLARNLFLSFDQTLERKIKEILLASQIEKKFTKDEILELYLNQIYFGGGAYGVQAAAKTYYGKNARDLTVPEAALIAGLPQSPSNFSPLVSEKAAMHRQILVLGRMYDQKFLTYKQYRKALLEARHPTFMTKKAQEFQVLEVPYFTTWVIRQLHERYDEDLLYRGGLRIHTTVDLRMQKAAEQSVKGLISQLGPSLRADCSALVCIENKTGYVRAMCGGLGWSSKSQFNRAWQAKRHPGSSFKPIVYSAALDNGYTPASVIMDGPITIQTGNTTWTPKNYDGRTAGPATLRSGIERSRNLMTVRLANDMGMKLVAEYAERFGVYDHLAPYLPMALGAGETTVMRMVSAYSIMANGGKSIKPSLIDRIQDRYGKTVYKQDSRSCEGCNATEWKNQPEPELIDNSEQVLDPMTAYQITSMMEGVVQRGTAVTISELGYPIAGKTGTTNDEKDAWFIGFTPNIVVGLYMGYDTPKGLGHGATGGGLAAPIFKDFMKTYLVGQPKIDFKVPEGMKLIAINRKTGMRASPGDPGAFIEAFKPGTGPADSYWVIGMGEDGSNGPGSALSPQASQAIQSGGGGLY